MNKEEFIEEIIEGVAKSAEHDVLWGLENLSGRGPRKKHIRQYEWYSKLTEEDREVLKLVITESVDSVIFDILTMLDGTSEFNDENYQGELKLYYEEEGKEYRLNKEERGEDYLHDIYNAIRNPED